MAKVLKKATAVAKAAYGKPLKEYGIKDADGNVITKLKYGFEWYAFEDPQSMVDAKEELSLAKQLKVVNDGYKTTARQAANAAATLAIGIIKPNEENDSQVRLKKVADGLYGKYVSEGMSAEDARVKSRSKAAEFLEEEWDDDDED